MYPDKGSMKQGKKGEMNEGLTHGVITVRLSEYVGCKNPGMRNKKKTECPLSHNKIRGDRHLKAHIRWLVRLCVSVPPKKIPDVTTCPSIPRLQIVKAARVMTNNEKNKNIRQKYILCRTLLSNQRRHRLECRADLFECAAGNIV